MSEHKPDAKFGIALQLAVSEREFIEQLHVCGISLFDSVQADEQYGTVSLRGDAFHARKTTSHG